MKNTLRSIVVLFATALIGTTAFAQPNKSPSPQPGLAAAKAKETTAAQDGKCKIGPDYRATVSKRPPFRRITSCETAATASDQAGLAGLSGR